MERCLTWEFILTKQHTLLFGTSHLPHITGNAAERGAAGGLQWSENPELAVTDLFADPVDSALTGTVSPRREIKARGGVIHPVPDTASICEHSTCKWYVLPQCHLLFYVTPTPGEGERLSRQSEQHLGGDTERLQQRFSAGVGVGGGGGVSHVWRQFFGRQNWEGDAAGISSKEAGKHPTMHRAAPGQAHPHGQWRRGRSPGA